MFYRFHKYFDNIYYSYFIPFPNYIIHSKHVYIYYIHSPIFTSVTSSINSSKKSLGLFNKNFNTFKRNWQQYNGNLSGKIGTIFKSNDVNSLKAFNQQINSGIPRMAAYNSTMRNCSDYAKNLAKQLATGKITNQEFSASVNSIGISSKIASVGIKALSIAGNALLMWGVTELISLTVKGLDELNNSCEENRKKISKLTNEYSDNSLKLDDINSILEDNKKKINEISALQNPTYVDDKELEKLKQENILLNEKKEIIERTQASIAKQGIEGVMQQFQDEFYTNDAKMEKATKISWKSFATLGIYNVAKAASVQEQDTRLEGTAKALKKLEQLQKLKEKLISSNENDENVKALEKKLGVGSITEVMDAADKEINDNRNTLEDYYNELSVYIDKIREFDPNLESIDAKYLADIQNSMYKFINPEQWKTDTITNILNKSQFSKLSDKIKEQISKGIKDTDLLNDEDAKKIIKALALKLYNNASDESLKMAASELYKAYSNGVVESAQNTSLVDFNTAFSGLGEIKDKLIELAASGKINPKVITSTEDYNELIKKTGLTAEEVTKKIKGMVTPNQSIEAVSKGLSSLTDLYDQANKKGFADMESLNSMDDAFKGLNSYEDFANTLSSGTASTKQIQSAFNQLTKEYLIQTDALKGLDEAHKDTYITQLKAKGLANAQEIVEQALFNNISTQEFVTKNLNKTQEEFNALSYDAQVDMLNQADASDICKGELIKLQMAEIDYNKNGLDVSGKIESLKNLATAYGILSNIQGLANYDNNEKLKKQGIPGVGNYTKADYKNAADSMKSQIEAQFLGNTKASYNGGADYQKSLEKAADNASSSAKESSSKVFDFIETRLSRLERRIKLFANKITDYTSSAIKKRLIENSIGAIGEKINAEIESLGVYMNKADSVNLDEYWKSQIRDGSLNIADIQDDDLSQALSDYQSWYEKALSCEEEIDSLKTSQLDKVKELSELQAKMYQNEMDYIDYAKEYKESMMSINDTNGKWNTSEDYQSIINLDNQKLELLAKQNSEYATYQLGLDRTSDAWQDVQEKIQNNVKSYNDILNDIAQKVKEIEELPIKKLQVWLDYYDSVTSEYKSKSELKSNKSDLSINDYRSQMNVNSESIAAQTKQMESYYWEYLRAGALGNKQAQLEYAQKYHEAQNAITQLKLANEELKKSLRDDVYWRNFERAHTSAQSLANILKGLSSLIDENSLFNKDTGGFTDSGRNKIALTVKQYETAKKEVSNYMKDIKKLETLYRSGFYSSNEYNEKLKELQQSLIDSTNDVKSYSDALVELTINQGQAEIDLLKETIEARKDALNKKKEYYDYDKTIRSKTKDIQSLETQKAALLATEDTLEKRKKLLEIEEELQSKRDDLSDTQTEHEIKLVVNGLDDFVNDVQTTYDDYSDKLKSSLEMQTDIINDANKMYAESYMTIKREIDNILKLYGVDISNSSVNFSGLTGFANGGTIAGQIRKNGDSLLASVNPGETILTQDFTKMLPNLVGTMKDFINIDIPNYSNFSGAKTPIVNINYDGNLVNVEGSATTSTIDELKQLTPQIAKEVTKSITQDLKKNGFK